MAVESLERLDLPDGDNFALPLESEISYDDFLKRYDGCHAEWINGKVEVRLSASIIHQLLAVSLVRILGEFVEEQNLGVVLNSGSNMKLDAQRRGREPDVFFLASQHKEHLKRTHLEGSADLAIEIISEESADRDRITKFDEYERGGVREYWLLDPETESANFYVLNETGAFHEVPARANGVYRSAILPGFWIKTDWLWQSPQPTLRFVRAEWESELKQEK